MSAIELEEETSAEQQGDLSIVVVDDKVQPLSADFLEDLNATLRYMSSLQEAESLLTETLSNTIVVLDLMFPDSSQEGLVFLRRFRAQHHHIPVIVYTNAPGGAFDRARDEGADFVLKKTTDPQKLREAIRLAVGRKVLQASVLCEVVDFDAQTVRVRLEGENGWYAERDFKRYFCPLRYLEPGATFWVDTYEVWQDRKARYFVEARPGDVEDERQTIEDWFGEA